MALPGFAGSAMSAVDALGLGDMLRDQVLDETEEARKKRMQQQQERSLMGPAASPATLALFGGGLSGKF